MDEICLILGFPMAMACLHLSGQAVSAGNSRPDENPSGNLQPHSSSDGLLSPV